MLAIILEPPRGLAQNASPLNADPNDPVCSSISRLFLVEAARSEAARQSIVQRKSTIPSPSPSLLLELDQAAGIPRLSMRGPENKVFRLEVADHLHALDWRPVVEAKAPQGSLSFSDYRAFQTAQRFYRFAALEDFQAEFQVENFRLIDQDGKSRELYYHTHWKAVVIAVAGEQLQNLEPHLPKLLALHTKYSRQNIGFWVLLSKSQPVRKEIQAQTQALGIPFPVLIDDELIVSRPLQLQAAGEMIVIRPPEFVVTYRGPISVPEQPALETTPREPLSEALDHLLKQQAAPVRLLVTDGPAVPRTAPVPTDYARDIAPVLREYCVRCHRPGDIGPFAMTNHNVIRERLYAIKHSIRSGIMPPWHADREYGKFANDLSLPAPAKKALLQWLDAGAPRGDGPDPLEAGLPAESYSDWPLELGEPDAIVTIAPQEIKAQGSEAYRYIHVQAPNTEDVWLKAALIAPSDRRAVHHYLVWPGKSTFPQVTGLAFYVPGVTPQAYPKNTGVLLHKESWLTFNLHYTPYGVDTVDQPRLALWYHKSPPAKELNSIPIIQPFFVIPAGAREHATRAQVTVNRPITIYRLYPHMHLRGLRMSYEVVYPDGQHEMLLSVPNYHFNWQTGYELAQPKTLPTGTQIIVQGAFDNSAQNLANPNSRSTVRWGEQSWEEMFIGYLDYTD